MRPLDLNLASRPFRNNTLLWLGYGIFAACTVGFTAWNTVTFVETGRTLAEARNTVGSIANREEALDLREHQAQAEIARYDLKYLGMETLRANDVILRKAMSWTRLFNLLEDTQPYEVRMVSVRPTFGASAGSARAAVAAPTSGGEVIPVAVDGTAKDLRAFLDFERALIRDPHFDRVEPERTTHSKGGELIFSLSFLYSPEGKAGNKEAEPAESRAEAPKEGPAGADTEAEAADPREAPRGNPEPTSEQNAAVPPPAPAPDTAQGGTVLLANPQTASPSASMPNVAAPSPQGEPNAETTESEPDPRERFRHKPKVVQTAPIRKRPPGWQPPDPFAKSKKEGEKDAPAAGDRK